MPPKQNPYSDQRRLQHGPVKVVDNPAQKTVAAALAASKKQAK
jgi:hypothetical protein